MPTQDEIADHAYGHTCDNCENDAYPLSMFTVRLLNGKVKTYWVCDRCKPAFEREEEEE